MALHGGTRRRADGGAEARPGHHARRSRTARGGTERDRRPLTMPGALRGPVPMRGVAGDNSGPAQGEGFPHQAPLFDIERQLVRLHRMEAEAHTGRPERGHLGQGFIAQDSAFEPAAPPRLANLRH